jgi:hypothetical protein
MKYLVIGAALALGASVSAASAATLTFSDSFGPALTEFATAGSTNPAATTPNADVLELSDFDGSLGTLTGVDLNFTVGYTSVGTVTNSAPQAQFADATQDVNVFIDSSVLGSTVVLAASDATGFTNFASGGSGTAIFLEGVASETATGLLLSDFIGAAGDVFTIDFATIVATGFTGGGGNLAFDVETLGFLEATVTYTFDEAVIVDPVAPSAVPLPASGLLLLAGLAGTALMRRKS